MDNTEQASDIRRLSELLEKVILIFEDDRKMALKNYDNFRGQLDKILANGMESSEDGKVEAEVNKALKNVFDSATRLQGVIDTISKVIIANLNNEARKEVAAMFNPTGTLKRVNIASLLDGPRKKTDDDDIRDRIRDMD